MSSMYKPAAEVEEIAEKLIATVARHEDLANVPITYVFIDKAPTSHGRAVLGRARKITGLSAFLTGSVGYPDPRGMLPPSAFFVVEISHDYWSEVLTDAQQVALVDHELCHCRTEWDEDTGEWKLSTVGHDVEEFACVVERHGLWSNGLAGLGRAMSEQLSIEVGDLTGGR